MQKCIAYVQWLAENAERILAPRRPAPDACIYYDPAGVVLGIMPWNFPLWQVVRFATPALIGGNVVIVKHSPLVPRCADALTELFASAGFEAGVFYCKAASSDIAQRLIADDRVRAVAFTGSSESGRAVAATAGQHLKRCVLELGGSDAFVVMPTANVAGAVNSGVESRMRAGGQACTSAKRFIVHNAIADDFEQRFVAAMSAIRIGDPFDPATDSGPLVSEDAANRLERQIRESVDRGAKVLSGGRRIDARIIEPTVLAIRDIDVPVMQEETFGPVAPIVRVANLDGAIDVANATRYGLSASVWTNDASEIAAFRSRLDVGQLFVNVITSSRVDLPFGGTKDSGFGRELGDAGVYEFVNVKTEVRSR